MGLNARDWVWNIRFSHTVATILGLGPLGPKPCRGEWVGLQVSGVTVLL